MGLVALWRCPFFLGRDATDDDELMMKEVKKRGVPNLMPRDSLYLPCVMATWRKAIGKEISPALPRFAHPAVHILMGIECLLSSWCYTWSFYRQQRCQPILGNRVFLRPVCNSQEKAWFTLSSDILHCQQILRVV